MTEPRRVELDHRHLLAVNALTLHVAPPELVARVVPPSRRHTPIFVVAAEGPRLTGAQDLVGLIIGAPNLGYLAGLAEARVREAGGEGLIEQYIAEKDQASGSARTLPAQSRATTEPRVTQRELIRRMEADVEARRGEVADVVATIREADDRDGALRDAYSRAFTACQEDPTWQATFTVAALLMLAGKDDAP